MKISNPISDKDDNETSSDESTAEYSETNGKTFEDFHKENRKIEDNIKTEENGHYNPAFIKDEPENLSLNAHSIKSW